jgi:taurine dioxygenase
MTFQTRRLPTIGQEVIGLDIDGKIDGETQAALRRLWDDTGLILFRGAGTSPEQLLRLSRVFGETEPHPIPDFRHPTEPELILLTNKGGLRGPVYAFDGVPTYGRIPWHTDLAFSTTPNAGAMLNMIEKAAIGGQTAWLDTEAAYAALDPSLKRRIAELEARFEFCADLSKIRFSNPGGVRVGETKAKFPDFPPITRPVVWQHPTTGRTILNICPLNIRNIVGMNEAESDRLIEELIAAVEQPEFIYEHAWEEGDIILWDNYRMMHRAEGHPVDVIRIVHRTTLRGDATVGRTATQLAETGSG